MSNDNMFREAALLQLTCTCWQIDKQLPKSLLSDLGNSEYLKARKLILPPDSIQMIKEVSGKARNYVRRICLPFPINGCLLIPKKLIPVVEEELKKYQWAYNSHVDDFLRFYPESIKDAKEFLGDLFNELDYPSVDQVRKRFRFEWRYVVIGKTSSNVLPPSLYQEEAKKFQSLMEQARTEAIASLREEFVGLIANLSDKLSGKEDGKPKRLRDAAIDNLKQFLDEFSARNMFHDDQLEELVSRCRNVVTGITAAQVRTNNLVKENLHNAMGNLLSAIDASLLDLPRRKLRFAA